MRKTSGNKTIREKLQAAKLMGGRRATNTFLKTFGITATDTCTLCGKHRDSNLIDMPYAFVLTETSTMLETILDRP